MSMTQGASRGNCNTVRWSFDKRQGAKTKAANEAGEDGDVAERPGLFDGGAGSVAAEYMGGDARRTSASGRRILE